MISNERGGILIVKFPDMNIDTGENFPFFQKERGLNLLKLDSKLLFFNRYFFYFRCL